MRAIYVSRDNPASRRECTDEILRRAKDSAAGWPKILIFPEATTHSTEVLLEYKKGAFLPSVPVQVMSCRSIQDYSEAFEYWTLCSGT